MTVAVIPARYASTRLPAKPLLDLEGQSLIRRVYDRVRGCKGIDEVLVATDDERILAHIMDFGGRAKLTSTSHRSGTDRVAEVAAGYPADAVILNVQGDEPFIETANLQLLIDCLQNRQVDLATLVTPIAEEADLFSPHAVKAVAAASGSALYFSRHALPYLRDVSLGKWIERGQHLLHLGVYAFRNELLQRLSQLPPGRLERLESLEQLRWLEAGFPIQLVNCNTTGFGIDTAADLEMARLRIRTEGAQAG